MSRTHRTPRLKNSYYSCRDHDLETKPGQHFGDRHLVRMAPLSTRVNKGICRGDWSDIRGKLRMGRALRICSKYIVREELTNLDLIRSRTIELE